MKTAQHNIPTQVQMKEGRGAKEGLNLLLPLIPFQSKTSDDEGRTNILISKRKMAFYVGLEWKITYMVTVLFPGRTVQILSWTSIWARDAGLHSTHHLLNLHKTISHSAPASWLKLHQVLDFKQDIDFLEKTLLVFPSLFLYLSSLS